MDLRTITFSTVYNFRDLGGLRTTDGQTVHYGRLYRSDSLHRLSEEETERLALLGIRTVLDLRRPTEISRDGRIPERDGMAYFNLHPVHREWNLGLYEGDPARYLADRYLDMAEEGVEGFGAALRLLSDTNRAPVVMHCFAGKDRTGVLAALTLALLEVTESDIMADYALSEAAQAPIGAQIRQEFPGTPYEIPPAYVIACPPRAIALFLADLKQRYGSIYGYARAAGVTALHVEALRSHLLA